MKCQILFSRINKENIISLSSAEFAHTCSMICVKCLGKLLQWEPTCFHGEKHVRKKYLSRHIAPDKRSIKKLSFLIFNPLYTK